MAVTARAVVYTMATSSSSETFFVWLYNIEIDFSEALKTGLETSQTPQKLPLEAASGENTSRDRFWTNFGLVFGNDFEV